MEPNKQGDAASSKPDADHEARLQARWFGDSSSPPLPNPQQVLAPTEAPVVPLREYQLFGPSSNAPAAPNPSEPVSAKEFSPTSLSGPFSFFSAMPPWTSISSTRQNEDGSLNPYASAQVSRAPANSRELTQDESQALKLLHEQPGGVGFARESACVVRLLKEDHEEARRSVFNGVKGALRLRLVMRSSDWHVVFVELLHGRRPVELQAIVDLACQGEFLLECVADNEYGLKSVEELFRAVQPDPYLRQQVIACLLSKFLFQYKEGPDVLRSIFATFSDNDCSIVIGYALDNYKRLFSSIFGKDSMVECFTAAKNPELHKDRFEDFIVRNTVEFVKGKYSNHFLQKVLERGSDQLKIRITEVIAQNLMNVSSAKYGTHVVQACFLKTGSQCPPLLQRVLTKFQSLHDEQLAQLARGRFSNFVVQKLLRSGKMHFPDETMELARRNQRLLPLNLALVDHTGIVGQVLVVVTEVLS